MVIARRFTQWSGNVASAWWVSEGLQCKENDRKSKIGGHWRVSDDQTHHHESHFSQLKLELYSLF